MNRSVRLFGTISGLALVGSGAYLAYNSNKPPALFTTHKTKTPTLKPKMTVNDKFEVRIYH